MRKGTGMVILTDELRTVKVSEKEMDLSRSNWPANAANVTLVPVRYIIIAEVTCDVA